MTGNDQFGIEAVREACKTELINGTKWVKGDDTIIYDRNGWHLNGQIVTKQEINTFLQYD